MRPDVRKVSVLAPLSDRQSLGWTALKSALSQDAGRDAYEIVAIVDRRSRAAAEQEAADLLAQCDVVVDFPGDAEDLANRVAIYVCGARGATTPVSYFTEGHAIMEPDCVSRIIEAFERDTKLSAVFAPTRSGSQTVAGRAFDAQQSTVSRRDDPGPGFGLGGYCAMRTDTFLHLAASLHGRGEDAFRNEVKALPSQVLSRPLSTHYNDYSFAWLVELGRHNGRCYWRNPSVAKQNRLPWFTALRGPLRFAVGPPAALLARILLAGGIGAFERWRGASIALLTWGLRFSALEGYCAAAAAGPQVLEAEQSLAA